VGYVDPVAKADGATDGRMDKAVNGGAQGRLMDGNSRGMKMTCKGDHVRTAMRRPKKRLAGAQNAYSDRKKIKEKTNI